MDPIVITSQEVAQTELPVPGAPGTQELRPTLPNPIPLWARLALLPLVPILPLLSLAALIIRVSVRGRTPRTQQVWSSYLLTLLIVSGLLSTLLVILSISFSWAPVPDAISSALTNLDEREAFPTLPTPRVMTGVELSSTMKPLVLLASPAVRRWFQHSSNVSNLLGAAIILESTDKGYLLATARHVADGESWLDSRHNQKQKVMVSDGMNGWAAAQVIARHKHLDIALLWLDRHSGSVNFRQPIATYSSVQTGEKIYVIGHPEGLNFSVSNGIVSRTPGDDILQISAPVSPGNSGGPVYDEYGDLLGVVTSKVDRALDPDAENLNFAVSTEALMHVADWDIVNDNKAPQGFLADFLRQDHVRKTLETTQ